jgi:hypothetical protein
VPDPHPTEPQVHLRVSPCKRRNGAARGKKRDKKNESPIKNDNWTFTCLAAKLTL